MNDCDIDYGSYFETCIAKQHMWDLRFMRLAKEVASWSSCYKPDRHVGAIITKQHRILTTGYNGAPSDVLPCRDRKECIRDKDGIKSGEKLEHCYAVHAEQNAIAQAARQGLSLENATLYCTHQPCSICAKLAINSGIKRIVYSKNYPDEFTKALLDEANISLERIEENEYER